MIGVREPQPAASEAFVKFADAHRSIEKFGIRLLKTIKPVGLSECSMPHWPRRSDSLAQEWFWAGVRYQMQTLALSPLWPSIHQSLLSWVPVELRTGLQTFLLLFTICP